MKKVGYDIDNVITQTYQFALNLVNRHLGAGYVLEDCFYQTVEECFDIPKEDVASWFKSPDAGFPMDLLPVKGAIATLNKYSGSLSQYFVSARNEKMKDGSLAWFDKESMVYVPENVFFGNNTPSKKAARAKELKLELFVEDDLDNANAVAEEVGILVLLVDFGYLFNRNRPFYHKNVKVVYDWLMIDGELSRILGPFKQ